MKSRWITGLVLLLSALMAGCATTIAPDTKLALQGPRAKISKSF